MNDETIGRPVEILLAEDEPGDVRLTQIALKEAKVCNRLHIVGDGVEALDFVRQRGKYKDFPRPDLILLDLNMPRKNGWEVLTEIKQDDDLQTIPVCMLTSSDAEKDVLRCYEAHANSYIVKPVDLKQFLEVIRATEEFWFSIVRLSRPVAAPVAV